MKKSQNIVNYSGIGKVLYARSSRARNLSIRINQQGEIRVTVPRIVSWRRAEAFFLSKQQWVLKKLDQMNSKGCRDSVPPEGESIRIRGRDFIISLQSGDSESADAIWRILQKEALNYLPERMTELSEAHGYKPTGLKIRRMKTRWGSCSARKSINLNSWLVMIPDPLSDYVILHELAHTRFPDHSSLFWEELDRTTDGLSRVYRKELRNHQIMCFTKENSGQ
ncbi:MAG: M48 family metallopeptidase [Bacteroidales bacterium]|nr:M48 family metallopeptidase [Bacteroidales bacterium]